MILRQFWFGGALAAACVASMMITQWFRSYALARRLVDVPNSRSSHTRVTPRGGGIAIVLVTLTVLLALGVSGVLPWAQVWGLTGGGAFVALVGHIDDRGHLGAQYRLVGHFVSAAWVLVWIGLPAPFSVFGGGIVVSWMTPLVAALYLVWLLNLTNFMDGIDGIAAIETITVCASGAFLSKVAGGGEFLTVVPLFVVAATVGFLRWNWPPARMFLGDAGSGFLGLTLGALSLVAVHTSTVLFWGWIILLAVFVVDATTTLLVRLTRGEKPHEAHRTHAYQHAARRLESHRTVTLVVAAINLLWLLPIAMLVTTGRLDSLAGVILAYSPLALGALWLRAGLPSAQ